MTTQMSFSRNCVSGISDKCQCWRCRESKGLLVTEETEAAAEVIAKAETEAFEERTRKFLRGENKS